MSDELCAICKIRKADHWDHDHRTGIIRGRLCGRCNRGLGFLEWADGWLEKALAYLASPPLLEEGRDYAEVDHANHRKGYRKYYEKVKADPEAMRRKREYAREWRAHNRDKILVYQNRGRIRRNLLRRSDSSYGRGAK